MEHHVHNYYYLSKQAGEMAWARMALQNVETTGHTLSVARQHITAIEGTRDKDTSDDKDASDKGAASDRKTSAPEGLSLTEREWVGAQLQDYSEAQSEVNRAARCRNGGAKTP